MPLMWAHAEYIKLVRSVADQKVFDLIPVVAERYRQRRGRKDLEVWKPIRRVGQVSPGQVLRIQTPEPFQLRWTNDEWRTVADAASTSSGLGINYVDLPIEEHQKTPVQFTFYWPQKQAWEGRDYTVEIVGAAE